MMTRSGIFRSPEGIAVDFSDRVFNLPSFRGMIYDLCTYYSKGFIGFINKRWSLEKFVELQCFLF